MLKIGDFSKLSRCSVRMLRHYDEIGLLEPAEIDRFTGYRYYSEAQLTVIGQIISLRGMGFSLAAIGEMLKLDDPERYQTVYSKTPCSAAAPTAGLHFTKELLEALKDKGVKLAFVTLHVGLGTFRPVKEDEITDHVMHSEFYVMDEETAKIINDTRDAGGDIWAVGTTATRTLETIADETGHVRAQSGWTAIFIYPGYRFKAVDHLITNFHLPESTLMMLISAFASREMVMNAYQEAIREEYRFFSFGDSMMLY